MDEAKRCLQCECLECVKVCAYLERFGAYPKKYAREIYNNESIVMGTRQANKLINSCSLCGLCEEVCPETSPCRISASKRGKAWSAGEKCRPRPTNSHSWTWISAGATALLSPGTNRVTRPAPMFFSRVASFALLHPARFAGSMIICAESFAGRHWVDPWLLRRACLVGR